MVYQQNLFLDQYTAIFRSICRLFLEQYPFIFSPSRPGYFEKHTRKTALLDSVLFDLLAIQRKLFLE